MSSVSVCVRVMEWVSEILIPTGMYTKRCRVVYYMYMEILVFIMLLALVAAGYAGYRYGQHEVMEQMHLLDTSEVGDELREAAQEVIHQRNVKRLNRILQKAHSAGRITNDGVEDMFCIGDRTASRYLHQLVQQGKLTRHGSGRGVYYKPVRLEPLPQTQQRLSA